MSEERLARWFRDVELTTGSERFAAHVSAAQDLVAGVTAESVLGLVRLACGHADEAAFASLSEAVRSHDASFGGRIDDLETRLGAAAVVVSSIEDGGDTGSAAALAVLSEGWAGSETPCPDLFATATATLKTRSTGDRSRRLTVAVGDPRAIKSFAAAADEEPTLEAVARHTDTQVSALVKWAKARFEAIAADAHHDDSVAHEESNLLWWAFSGYSEIADTPWSTFDPALGVPVTMGVEFAGLVTFTTPPASAVAILTRLLGSSGGDVVSLADAVEGACRFAPAVTDIPETEMFPILLSLNECRELESARAWRSSVQRWGINTSATYDRVSIAAQTVRELLLLRLVAP